jgi:hypothetical protein
MFCHGKYLNIPACVFEARRPCGSLPFDLKDFSGMKYQIINWFKACVREFPPRLDALHQFIEVSCE